MPQIPFRNSPPQPRESAPRTRPKIKPGTPSLDDALAEREALEAKHFRPRLSKDERCPKLPYNPPMMAGAWSLLACATLALGGCVTVSGSYTLASGQSVSVAVSGFAK